MKFAHIRKLALSLPETSEEPHFQYSSFRVRGKIFITVPPDEQYIHVFVGEQLREPALAMYVEFIEKLTWGNKVVGLRVALPKAIPGVVKQLVIQAWQARAPKRLVGKACLAFP